MKLMLKNAKKNKFCTFIVTFNDFVLKKLNI